MTLSSHGRQDDRLENEYSQSLNKCINETIEKTPLNDDNFQSVFNHLRQQCDSDYYKGLDNVILKRFEKEEKE